MSYDFEDIDAGCRAAFGMSWEEFIDLPEDETDALLRDHLASPEFDQRMAFMREHHPAEAMVAAALIERFRRDRGVTCRPVGGSAR